MREPLRFGLVGVGGIGRSYLQVFGGLREARIEGVADTDPDAAASAATTLGCESYADHRSLVAAVDLDAVIICTPPSTHIDIARDFVERGVAVLIEKPFAINVDDARDLIGQADRSGVQVTMASKFRYVGDIVDARRLLDAGSVGEAILFENAFASRVPMAGRWNADPAVSGGGVLMDNGTHSVDVARFLFGPVIEVSAAEGKRVQSLPVEDTAQMLLCHSDGAMGTVAVSWSIEKATDVYFGIYGSEGAVEIGWKASRYREGAGPGWVPFGSGYDKITAMREQVLNFCRALQGSEPLLITATDAIASVDVIAAAYASIAEGRRIDVPEAVVRAVDAASSGSQVA